MGVGYKASIEDGQVVLRVGLSHPVKVSLTPGVDCQAPSPNKLNITGIDLRSITRFAANIRRIRPPEPYSCKGIYVSNETIKKKEGKRNSK